MSRDVKAFEAAGTGKPPDRAGDAPRADAPPPDGQLEFARPSPEETIRLFEEAVRTQSRRLLAIARAIVGNRASPEDVVQQALANLYQHRDRYDRRLPRGLLKWAVVNEALRILRQPKMSIVSDDHPGKAGSGPSDGLVVNETVRQVRDAIAKLPEHYRAALVLCEYEDMPYAQIAETLDASVPQIKTWIFRARRQLAEMLKGLQEN